MEGGKRRGSYEDNNSLSKHSFPDGLFQVKRSHHRPRSWTGQSSGRKSVALERSAATGRVARGFGNLLWSV